MPTASVYPGTDAPTDGTPDPAARPIMGEALAGGYAGLATVGATMRLGRFGPWDDPQRTFGDRLYDRMHLAPPAFASVKHLTVAVLANDLKVVPAVAVEAGGKPSDEERADAEFSAQVAAYVSWVQNNLVCPIHEVAYEQIMGALEYGCNVADKVWDYKVPPNESAPQLVLKAVKPKNRRAWAFEVDAFWNLLYVLGSGPQGWQRWPREKFSVLTWGGRGGDPRGESAYQPAVEAWNFWVQIHEVYFRFLQRFGTPKTVGKLSDASMRGGSGTQAGSTVLDRFTNAVSWFKDRLLEFTNGAVLAVGKDDVVEVHEVQREGHAFTQALDVKAREMVQAILLQVRATVEAKNGSKADSETSQDVLGNLIMYLRRWYCRSVEWELYYLIVLYRYGPEVAARHTPRANLGEVDHQDVSNLITALAHAGYTFDAKQFPGIDKHLGMVPVRTAEDIEEQEAAKAAAAQAAADAKANADAGQQDQGGDGNAADGSNPAEQPQKKAA